MTANAQTNSPNEVVILTESGGMPLTFWLIRGWGEFLAKTGFKAGRARPVAVCSFMCLPLILLVIRHWPYRTLSAFWAVWLVICNSLIVLLSWHTWDAFMNARCPVIEMTKSAPAAEIANLEAWYRRAFRLLPQLIVSIFAALLTLAVGLQLPAPIVERVPVAMVSLLVSGFVAGHAFYFIVYTALFCRKVSQVPNLQLTWNAPIDTPGLYALSRANQLEAQMGIVLFLAVAVPLTYAYVKAPSFSIRVLYLGEMLLSLLCILAIGLIIQGWLAGPARRSKRATLEGLSSSIDILRAGRSVGTLSSDDLALIKERLDLYELLNGSPESFFRAEVVTQYATSVAAAALPFIIAFLLK